VRNLLKFLRNIWSVWVLRVDGMIHPEAAGDDFLVPLHRTFLTGCFAAGAAALVILPLHLALAGPPHATTLLALAWMLCQWPLALYASQSGRLNRAIGLSAGLFALFVAAVCLVTGGAGSFALLWLLIPPMEAALSTSRRTIVAVTTLCVALLTALTFAPLPAGLAYAPASGAGFVTTLAAITYVGMLALRVSLGRKRAQAAVKSSESRRQVISQSVSDAYFELEADGSLRVMCGPVKQLLGHVPAEGGDWLFARLHVADRPLYLTYLSDIRVSGRTQDFEVRLRVGASRPGEAGQAEYRSFSIQLRRFREEQSVSADDRVLLTLRGCERSSTVQTGTRENTGSRVDRLARSLLEGAGSEARQAFSEILQQAGRLKAVGMEDERRAEGDTATAIAQSGERGFAVLDAALDLVPGEAALRTPDIASVNIAECLEGCVELVAPAAARRQVFVDLAAGMDLAPATGDRRMLRQAVCFLLADMIETSDAGAVLTIAVKSVSSGFDCTLSVKNRQSSLSWSSGTSKPVLDLAQDLLERTGCGLSVETVLGQGECLHVHLPRRALSNATAAGFERKPVEQNLARSA
jgi:cell cycle sensor histidine kinase DivJ